MNLYCIIFGIIFFILGITFLMEIAPSWIKEWRETPECDKKKVNIRLISKNVGFVFLTASAIFMISSFNQSFKENYFLWCMIIWLIGTGVDVAFISKSTRYKND